MTESEFDVFKVNYCELIRWLEDGQEHMVLTRIEEMSRRELIFTLVCAVYTDCIELIPYIRDDVMAMDYAFVDYDYTVFKYASCKMFEMLIDMRVISEQDILSMLVYSDDDPKSKVKWKGLMDYAKKYISYLRVIARDELAKSLRESTLSQQNVSLT